MRIGFAGLGALGAPMAARVAPVHQLIVWNRSPERADVFAPAWPWRARRVNWRTAPTP